MHRIQLNKFAIISALILCCCLGSHSAHGQISRGTFTYQGFISDAGSPANGPYDLQFKLFDAASGSAQIGSTVARDDVAVTNGVFTLQLDFGGAAFPGAARWLEISVRPGASVGAYTTLSPRQQVTSTPYAIKSLNADQPTAFRRLASIV